MLKRKVVLGLAVCLLAALFVSQSLSQPAQQGQGRQRGGQGGQNQGQRAGARQFDPEQMQRMMEQRTQEQLGASDAEWKEIGPLVMKVQELSRQSTGRGRMMSGMGRQRAMRGERPGGQNAQAGASRGRGRQAAPEEMTEVEKASEELRTVLENPSATPEQIKEKLTVLRTAKEKEKEALVTAQKELQKKVTPRQEAQLVLMGLLD